MAKKTINTLLTSWKKAWDNAPSKSNPLSVYIDGQLSLDGYSIVDVLTQIGKLSKIDPSAMTKHERDFLEFHMRTKAVAESSLVDTTLSWAGGAIFLLKAKHGYAETNKIEQTSTTKVVMDWGSDDAQ
jgi:hypothetical protein